MKKNILLHSCCSPCSTNIFKNIKEKITIIFYNPNINIKKEYTKRKLEVIKIAKIQNLSFIDSDYNTRFWTKNIKKYKNLKEKNKRCVLCFKIRLEYISYIANKYNYNFIATSLTNSNKKDKSQINIEALNAIKKYNGLNYITFENIKQIKTNMYYKQKYCGCTFSLL